MKYKLISFLKLLVKILKYIRRCLGSVFFEIGFIIKVNSKGIKSVLGSGVTTGKTSPKSQIVQGPEFILIFCDREPKHIEDEFMFQRRVEKKPGPLLLKRGVSLLAELT